MELTPYKLPGAEQIMLVPRVIIPLPEARDYIVSVERKEAIQRKVESARRVNEMLWRAIADAFNALGLPFQCRSTKSVAYSQVTFGDPNAHYEWQIGKRLGALGVALHFEHSQPDENYRLLDFLTKASSEIGEGVPWDFRPEKWGQKWARAQFLIPYEGNATSAEIAPDAAATMKTLIERTWPLIRDQVKARDEFRGFPESS